MIRYVDANGVLLTREEYRAGLGAAPVQVETCEFEESIVDQADAVNHDLETLVKRWTRGEPPPVFTEGQFADVSTGMSYQDVQDRLVEFGRAFDSLPYDVRERFQNSAIAFADAVVDPTRVDELVELGIFKRSEAKSETPPVVPPPAAGPGVSSAPPPMDKPA